MISNAEINTMLLRHIDNVDDRVKIKDILQKPEWLEDLIVHFVEQTREFEEENEELRGEIEELTGEIEEFEEENEDLKTKLEKLEKEKQDYCLNCVK